MGTTFGLAGSSESLYPIHRGLPNPVTKNRHITLHRKTRSKRFTRAQCICCIKWFYAKTPQCKLICQVFPCYVIPLGPINRHSVPFLQAPYGPTVPPWLLTLSRARPLALFHRYCYPQLTSDTCSQLPPIAQSARFHKNIQRLKSIVITFLVVLPFQWRGRLGLNL